MSISDQEVWWLAGLLEGEGSFCKPFPSAPNKVTISVQMTDEDVIARVAGIFKVKYHPIARRKKHHKDSFGVLLRGRRAVDLMQRLRPLMGSRRQTQIDAALSAYDPELRTKHCVNTRILTDEAVDEAHNRIVGGESLRENSRRLKVHHESLRRRIIQRTQLRISLRA